MSKNFNNFSHREHRDHRVGYSKFVSIRVHSWLIFLLCVLCVLCGSNSAETGTIHSFSTGEVTPDFAGRTDLKKYYSACRLVENMFVWPHGPLQKRSGTYYIATAATTRPIPAVLGDYPTLRATTDQADLGLVQGTAVTTLTNLQDMRNDLTANYYLTGNIDASATSGWNGGQGFEPIGKNTLNRFTGTFDGNGYTITGLFINRNSSYNGLFGWIEGTAKIANVTMASVDITGRNNTGALTGEISGTATDEPVIQNCSSSGTIKGYSGTSSYSLGGLIGFTDGDDANSKKVYIYDSDSSCTVDENSSLVTSQYGGLIGSLTYTTIQNCYATGNIDGTDTTSVGGLVGGTSQEATVSYCYATGDVIAKDAGGGLVGFFADSDDTITKSYATGNITNTESRASPIGFGGLVGYSLGGTITDCYAWGDVSSDQAGFEVGGLVGEDTSGNPDFTNSYSIGSVTGESTPGGLIGNIAEGGSDVVDCFWDTETSGTAVSDGGSGRITTWMKTNANYPDTWDFDTIWFQEYTPPGTVAIDPAPVRLFAFDHSTEKSHVIEMGDRYMRFLKEE